MEVTRRQNEKEKNIYDYTIKNGKSKLEIYFGGTLDLFFEISDGTFIPKDESGIMSIDITKENYEIFCLFKDLHEDVINCRINENDSLEKRNKLKFERSYNLLVDDKKSFEWVHDDQMYNSGDRFVFSKVDDDTYRMDFIRTSINEQFDLKNGNYISVRIRNSGSRYEPFNIPFMRFYNKLQEIDPNYHQIHIEELLYQPKTLKKRKIKQ